MPAEPRGSRQSRAADTPSRPALELQWYREGLRFACVPGCGNCCSGHGVVRVDLDEIDLLAAGLGMERADFARRYVRSLGDDGWSLTDQGPHGDCVFLQPDKSCRVYAHRPRQCRTWPFWVSNLVSRKAWEASAERCPGMNQGPAHSAEEAERIATTPLAAGCDP